MLLKDLLPHLPGAELSGPGETAFTAVEFDSRRVGPGALFAAVPGFRADGHDYLREALAAGAAALLVQADRRPKWEGLAVPTLAVPDTREALAPAAAAFFGRPARRLTVIGVTGTDGKTSLCHLIAHVLESAGESVGLMSTAENRAAGRALADSGRFTTPEAPEVQSMLAQMADAGCRFAVLEATSHGLALHRLDCCEFDVAVMTNVASDHMDFHGSDEEYLAAKGRLFQMLDSALDKGVEKTAVLNADDPAHRRFRSLTAARAVTYAMSSPADVSAADVRPEGWTARFRLDTPPGSSDVCLGRPGAFNVSNALAAAAVALALGLELPPSCAAWSRGPGRRAAWSAWTRGSRSPSSSISPTRPARCGASSPSSAPATAAASSPSSDASASATSTGATRWGEQRRSSQTTPTSRTTTPTLRSGRRSWPR